MLRRGNRIWNMQKNETMNTSVAALAQKNKTYSMSASLMTRVSIAAGCQISGFANFWSTCCTALGFDIDPHLHSILAARDRIKRRKNMISGTIEGKTKRSAGKYDKYNSAFKKQRDDHKQGLSYQPEIAATAAKKNLPAASARNPKGTPKSEMRCPYHHPSYCTLLGHSSAAAGVCALHKKSKEVKDAATKVIMGELIAIEVSRMKDECMYFL